jgi:hypothetical protein
MSYGPPRQSPYGGNNNEMGSNGYVPVPPPHGTYNNHPYMHRQPSFDSVSDVGHESQETLRQEHPDSRPDSFIGFPRPPLSLNRHNAGNSSRTLADLQSESPPGTPNFSKPKPWGLGSRPESSTTLISPYSATPSPYVSSCSDQNTTPAHC